MAFASVGSLGGVASKTADQGTFSNSITAGASVGDLVVVAIATDNFSASDGTTSDIASVTDSRSNTYSLGYAYTNGQGSNQNGATVAIYYSVLTTALQTNDLISANYSNASVHDASAMRVWRFTFSGTLAVEATNFAVADGAGCGSLNATTANIACLRVRAVAIESPTAAFATATASWTTMGSSNTSGGGGASNMGCSAEFIISTGTGSASNPGTQTAADNASVYVAFKEATGDVTVGLTGTSATASPQNVVPNTDKALSGQEGTSSIGILSVAIDKALSTQLLTASAGTLTPSIVVALVGTSATASPGTVTASVGGADVTVALTGQSMTISSGLLAPDILIIMSGQGITTTMGVLLPDTAKAMTGQEIASAIGSLTVSTATALSGQVLTPAAGSLAVAISKALDGQSISASIGTITVEGSAVIRALQLALLGVG